MNGALLAIVSNTDANASEKWLAGRIQKSGMMVWLCVTKQSLNAD